MTWARAASSRGAPPSSRRSVPVTTSRGVGARVLEPSRSTAAVSTGCGDTSTNTPCPSAASARTDRRTAPAARRLSYQYPASSLGPVQPLPGHRRDHGTRPARARSPASSRPGSPPASAPPAANARRSPPAASRARTPPRLSTAAAARPAPAGPRTPPSPPGPFTAATDSRLAHRRQPLPHRRPRAQPPTPSRPAPASPAAPGCAPPPPAPRPPAIKIPGHRAPPRSPPANDPATASGVTPAACHTAASDTITAHSTGCTTSRRSRPGAPSAPGDHLLQRPVHVRRQRRPALGQPGREHRAARRQLPAHPGPLRPLTREHEHHPARPARRRPPR